MAAHGKGPRKQKAGGPGREPLFLDPARRTAILDAVRNGATFKVASLAAGVGYSTFREWRQRGREDGRAKKETVYSALLADVKKASAEFITRNVKAISDHGDRSWQARAWLLERRRPDLFSDQRAEVRRLTRVVEDLLKQIAEARSAEPTPHRTDLPPA